MISVEQPFGLFRARPHPTRPNQLSYVENNQFNNFATSADDVVESDSKEASEQFGTWQQWLAVRQAYESSGLILYGDESITNAADIEALHPLVHGVNVKVKHLSIAFDVLGYDKHFVLVSFFS
jgi:hypothetical protein